MSLLERSGVWRALPALFAALALVFVGVPATTHAAESATSTAARSDVKVGAFTYDLDEEEQTATLTGWSGKRKKKIDIPAAVRVGGQRYQVTAIGYGAFAGPVGYVFPDRSPVPATKVTIPNGVEQIADFAFYGNRIKSFVIPASVTWIGTRALDQEEALDRGWRDPLRKVTFRGDAPEMSELGSLVCSPGGCGYNGLAPLGSGNGLIVYYKPGAKGFTSPIWAGYMSAPIGSKPVPTGYGRYARDLAVALDRDPVAGAKVTARLRPWAVGGKLSPKPKKLTFLWQLRGDNGKWKRIGSGKSVRLPKGSAGRVLRILTIAKGPGKREAVLQLKGIRVVLHTFAKKPKPTITRPAGVKRVTVGTKLSAEGAQKRAWSPKPDSVRYQWYRNGTAITKKGSKRTYKVTSADLGKKLTVRVTASKRDYRSASRASTALKVPKRR